MQNAHAFLEDWILWFDTISRPDVLQQLGLLLLMGLIAYGLVRLLRQRVESIWPATEERRSRSVLFGQRHYDGVLFPLLWLLLASAAPWMLGVETQYSVFRVALPVLLALVLIRLGAKLLRLAYEETRWVRLVENTISWAVWIVVVLWMFGVLPVILEQLELISFKIGSSQFTVLSFLQGALLIAMAVMLSFWLASLIEQRLLRNAIGNELSMRKIASNMIRAGLAVFAVMLAMSLVGIDLTVLSVLGGALGVGIGLGLQKLAANYVSGFVLLAERNIRIGDSVVVDGFSGKVTDIRARYTTIRSLSGVEAILPNELMVTQRVENNSLHTRALTVSTTVTVAYDSDAELVRRLLIEAARDVPRVIGEASVNLSRFSPEGLEFSLGIKVEDPDNGTAGLFSEINRRFLERAREHGIEFPLPKRLYPVPEAGASTAPGDTLARLALLAEKAGGLDALLSQLEKSTTVHKKSAQMPNSSV